VRAGDLALAAYRALSRSDQELVREADGPSREPALPSTAAPSPTPALAPPRPPSPPYRGPDVLPPAPVPASPQPPPASPRPVPAHPGGVTWEGGTPRPPASPVGSPWSGEFGPPPVFSIPHRVGRGEGKRRIVVGVVAVVAAVVLAAVALRFLLHSSHSTAAAPAEPSASTAASPTTPTISAAEAQARLSGLLPAGYPPDTCRSIVPPKGAIAAVSCPQNVDPDGPLSAIYTLYPDIATVRSAFDQIVRTSAVIVCPGRIQSPGAWHHVANPDTPSGMVLCAATQGNPTIAWTNDSELLVSVVQSDPQGPAIDQLFAWWSSHS
jgi:serine/threonine kinase PknH